MHVIKLIVGGLGGQQENAQLAIALLKGYRGVTQVDVNIQKGLVRIVSTEPVEISRLQGLLRPHHLDLLPIAAQPVNADSSTPASSQILKVAIEGMTCHSCEVMIERAWKKLPAIKKVEVDATRGRARIITHGIPPMIAQLQNALGEEEYRVKAILHQDRPASPSASPSRPSMMQLVGIFALVLLLGKLFFRLGLLQPTVTLGASMTVGAVLLLGLVAASSSCIAVSGGLLLSSAATFNRRYSSTISSVQRMRPVLLFVGGRLLSYALLGGIIGLVGKALTPSPLVVGAVTILAAVSMLVMGLEMLHLSPAWLKRILPHSPKRLSHAVMDMENGTPRWWTPVLLGAGTFFLPCGFTQALQLYALTTGSALTSGMLLFAFALGTAPALLALGWASNSLKGAAGRFFFQFSGALVVVLGFWNIQNGFAITGYPLSLPTWDKIAVARGINTEFSDPYVTFDGKQQVVKMTVTNTGYTPEQFTLRSGVPTRWEVDAKNTGGCLTVLQAPQLGIRKLLQPGTNTISFTAQQPGTYAFSCSMGMYRGTITVVAHGS
ncbi:sulfite exporter TauE/SafE family protein [Candidatus Uhrbacteria bacterium]|nr:sulfite exporter TauE/SafE family protein [Candidatus Uhrbacteria bacterium]